MRGFLLFLMSLAGSAAAFGQITVFQDNFESGDSWTRSGDISPNQWIVNSCVFNAGANSLYITSGGSIPGCGPTGTEQYAYANAPAGNVHSAYVYHSVDASCLNSIDFQFDYQIDGTASEDYFEVVYSTDGGTSWIPVGTPYVGISSWSSTSISLPGSLQGTTFDLGFRFVYNDATISGNPPAIDNVVVSGFDTENPVVLCPGDTNVYLDNFCAAITPDFTSLVSLSDNCSLPINIGLTQSPASGTPYTDTNSIVIQMTGTDEAGNFGSCSFVMRLLDTIPTQITCPSDSNVYVNNICQFVLDDFTNDAVVYDNCASIGSLTLSQTPAIGSSISASQSITITVNGGNPAIPQSCSFTLHLIDTIAPEIVCPTPGPLYVDASCQALVPDYSSMGVINENCSSGISVSQSPLAGSTIGVSASQPFTLAISDSAGNTGSCQFSIQVIDTISPSITCPSPQSVFADVNCLGTLGDYTALATGTDNCSASGVLTYSQSPTPGTTFNTLQNVTITVSDQYGNSGACSFTVNSMDTIAPTISCPVDQNVTTTTGCGYSLDDFTTSATVSDNCSSSGFISVNQVPAAGTILSIGTNLITLTAIDEVGNSSSCTFNVTVSDQMPPVFTSCPPTQVIFADNTCTGVLGDYTVLAGVNDNCTPSGSITLTQNPPSGTSISTSTNVTITATDAGGNSSTCIVLAFLNDTISPSVTCPSDTIITANNSCNYLIPDLSGDVTGSDNCSMFANMTITQNPAAGSSASGTTAVLITLLDEGGNSTSCVTNVIPTDTIPPTVTCPTPGPQHIGTLCDYTLPNYGTQTLVLDNCGGFSITQSPAPGTVVGTGTTIITMTVTDVGNNQTTCSFPLQILETVNPTISCPADISTCDPVVTFADPTFSDNCFAFLTQTDNTGFSSGSTFPIGTTTLSYTATDSSGNTAGCSFNIQIFDFPSSANIAADTLYACGIASSVLQADPITSGNGMWTVLSGQGTFVNNQANVTAVNNLSNGLNAFIWTVSSASCGSLSDTVYVSVSATPGPASIFEDTIFNCSNPTVDLIAAQPLNGTGAWSTNDGGTILNPANNVTQANLSAGWNTFFYTVTNGGCPPVFDSIAVFYSNSAPVITLSDTNECLEDNQNALLSIDPIMNGQLVQWSLLSGGASILTPNAISTEVSSIQHGTTLIMVEVSTPNCPSAYDTVALVRSLCDGLNPVFPTVITPNFDGKNDVFEINSIELLYPNCQVTIFNRWGAVVFESTGYTDPWDGTYKEEQLPMGTYFYRIELNDSQNTVYEGDISIIR